MVTLISGHEPWGLFTAEDLAEDLRHKAASSTAGLSFLSLSHSPRRSRLITAGPGISPADPGFLAQGAQVRGNGARWASIYPVMWRVQRLMSIRTNRVTRGARDAGAGREGAAEALHRGRHFQGQALSLWVGPTISDIVTVLGWRGSQAIHSFKDSGSWNLDPAYRRSGTSSGTVQRR